MAAWGVARPRRLNPNLTAAAFAFFSLAFLMSSARACSSALSGGLLAVAVPVPDAAASCDVEAAASLPMLKMSSISLGIRACFFFTPAGMGGALGANGFFFDGLEASCECPGLPIARCY